MKAILVAALISVLMLGGCGDADEPSGTSPQTPSRVLVSWSEADPDADPAWLAAHMTPQLVTTEQQRAEFLDSLPAEYAAAAAPVSDADLATHTLVVAGFSECGNVGRVSVVDGEVRHSVKVTEDINCYWAPKRVQVFEVSGTGLRLRF